MFKYLDGSIYEGKGVPPNIFAKETNAYRERCNKVTANADPDEIEVKQGLAGFPHAKAVWQQDYDLQWVPLSLGQSLKWFGMHAGMAIRPRNNTAAYWDSSSYVFLRADDFNSYLSLEVDSSFHENSHEVYAVNPSRFGS